jgi:hypothetical protein
VVEQLQQLQQQRQQLVVALQLLWLQLTRLPQQ